MAVGDSITDGFNAQLNANGRWPSLLARRLVGALGNRPPGVVDEAISGNRVLNDSVCFGQSAPSRFMRDALSVPGVRDVILLEGINDTRSLTSRTLGASHPTRTSRRATSSTATTS